MFCVSFLQTLVCFILLSTIYIIYTTIKQLQMLISDEKALATSYKVFTILILKAIIVFAETCAFSVSVFTMYLPFLCRFRLKCKASYNIAIHNITILCRPF